MADDAPTQGISKEKFEEMRAAIDKDGDGSVTKVEFLEAYNKLFPDMSAEEKDAIWTKMDADKSGTLEVQELAAYFGYNWDSEASTEMTDEQILEALQMQAKLAELEAEKAKPKEEPKPADDDSKSKGPDRDASIKMVNSDSKKSKGDDPEEADIRSMMECCTLGELEAPKDPKDANPYLQMYIDKGTNMRVEDEKGEMPLHKLARVKVVDSNRLLFKSQFSSIVKLMREQASKMNRKSIVTDVNHQDKAGKTPLFMAVEHKNLELLNLLYTLKVDGPDSIMVNAVGWTVMHAAVNTDDLETLKELVKHFTPARTKLLLQTPDKTGREPLHIAAYKCSPEMVNYLLDLGAKDAKKDSAGNTASKLADRAGRRKSREVIEERLAK